MRIQAVLLAGDRGASRAVQGRSKPHLELAGKPMFVHVLEALLHTPEVSEVFIVGAPEPIERALREHGCLELAAVRSRPIHVVPQRDTLYQNLWHTFLRTLPRRDGPADHPILIVPCDIPMVVPEEISQFVRAAFASGGDYVVGLSPDVALERFRPRDGSPGIEMAYFNLAEGRFRQNNLHFVRPLRFENRHYIQDMYEHRYQKEFGHMLKLALRILRREYRRLWIVFYYLLIHLAGWLDRNGHPELARRVRRRVPLATVERGLSGLLRTRFRLVMTDLGGAAVDVDNEHDLAVATKLFHRWKEMQARLARSEPSGREHAA
ncbi:MAG: nucleotidyltransferase family protein [Myxococcota bacterium]